MPDADPDAGGRLSWNFALDLWLPAELVALVAVVLVLALLGRMPGSWPVAIRLGWLIAFALLSWYHRSIEAQVVRTDRLRQALIDWVKASLITLVGAFVLGALVNVSRPWMLATFVGGVATISLVGATARAIIGTLSRRARSASGSRSTARQTRPRR